MTFTLSLLTLLVAPPSLALVSVGAGQSCKKAGLTIKNRNGSAFVCKKVGTRLVWKKSLSTISTTPAGSSKQRTVDLGDLGLLVTQSVTGQKVSPIGCKEDMSESRGHRINEALVMDPSNSNSIVVGIEWEGIFRTIDGGATWKISQRGLKSYPGKTDVSKPCPDEFGKMVMDPRNSKHLVLIRTDSPGGIDRPFGEIAGLYQSEDAGQSWTHITRAGMESYGRSALAIDPQNSDIIWTGVSNAASGQDPGETKSRHLTTGIVYRSVNRGKTWSELPTGLVDNVAAVSLIVDPANSLHALLFTMSREKTTTGPIFTQGLGVLETTDAGKTWNSITSRIDERYRATYIADAVGNGLLNIILEPWNQNQNTISRDGGVTWSVASRPGDYVVFDHLDPTGLKAWGASSGTITRSLDGGATWTETGTIPAVNGATPKVSVITTALDGTILAAGRFSFPQADPFIYRSTDNGASWTRILSGASLTK